MRCELLWQLLGTTPYIYGYAYASPRSTMSEVWLQFDGVLEYVKHRRMMLTQEKA